MKNILLIIVCFIAVQSMAQSNQQNYVGGENYYLCRFIGYDLNDDTRCLEKWLYDQMYDNIGDKDGKGFSQIIFAPKFPASSKEKINFKLGYEAHGDSLIVNSFVIDGYEKNVVHFFLHYWPSKVNFEELKNKTSITEYCIDEKAVLTINPATYYAKIVVTKNK